MTPISLDLRQRIVTAYENNEGSRAALAKRFAVGTSSVDRFIAQHRATGSLAPQPRGGSKPSISETETAHVKQWIEAESDLSQDQLAKRFEATFGRPVGSRTMGRLRERLGLSRKKSP